MSLSNAAFAVYGVLLVGIALVVGTTIGWDSLTTQVRERGYVQKLYELGPPWTHWSHGLMLCICPLIYPLHGSQ